MGADSDQIYNVQKNGQANADDNGRSFFKRSLSDGNILHENITPETRSNIKRDLAKSVVPDQSEGEGTILTGSTPEISTCDNDLACSRYTHSMPRTEIFGDVRKDRFVENDNPDAFDSSNFVDLDWLSSSGNSCEEELMDRSLLSSENVVSGITLETMPSTCECGSSIKGREQTGIDLHCDDVPNYEVLDGFSDSFVRWVNYGEMLCH